jgi:hypothetical protein
MQKIKIEVGDSVRHYDPQISGGCTIPVLEASTDGNHFKCAFFIGDQGIHKIDWFHYDDLTLIHKGKNH